MLTITKLSNAEYVLGQVAAGIEDYYVGSGEAPGVWQGEWAKELGLEGVVQADDLRSLLDGLHPVSSDALLSGVRGREVKAFDLTFSAPKSVSLLWAFGTPATSSVVSISVVESADVALRFLERHAAVSRQQVDGVRGRVPAAGWAAATFTHRTSREGDPQLHLHCIVPNVVRRPDGSHVALDAGPMHVWLKAAGSIFQAELQRRLVPAARGGLGPGPKRHPGADRRSPPTSCGCSRSGRVQIEAQLAGGPGEWASPAARMRANDQASLDTRARKDTSLTPEVLRDRWRVEADEAGIGGPSRVDRRIRARAVAPAELSDRDVFARLVDPERGLCAHDARFNQAHVVAAVAAMSGGRWTVEQIEALAGRFLDSDLVVRLAPAKEGVRERWWSTVEHRHVEDRLISHIDALIARHRPARRPDAVEAALAAELRPLGSDQRAAVELLCGEGGAVRLLVSPAGFGKTTTLHAAASAAADRRPAGDRVGGDQQGGRRAARRRPRGLHHRPLRARRLPAAGRARW